MKTAVVVFPGSNCDQDAVKAAASVAGATAVTVWHKETALPDRTDLVVLPGGFSYGDYLRCGAMAANSAIMNAVKEHAAKGGLVLGICNGFQVLTEMHLLPGALMRNAGLKFLCKSVELRVETTDSDFTAGYTKGQIVSYPVAHHDGNYTVDAETLARLEGEGRVAFRYVANPNGSMNDIAGILSENRRVLGLMPHPERALGDASGGGDGAALFSSLMGKMALV